MNFDYKKVR